MTRIGTQQKPFRGTSGSALVELASIAWILPIASMLTLNAALVGFAAWINDSACRDVARAAADEPTSDRAFLAATNALKAFAVRNSYAATPELLKDDPDFQYEIFPDEDGNPQLEKGPYVKVTTSMNVKLPAPVLFAGNGLANELKFRQSYTYPLLCPRKIEK